jgi:hypothetical protein
MRPCRTESADQQGRVAENVERAREAQAASECRYEVGDAVNVRDDKRGPLAGVVVETWYTRMFGGPFWVVRVRLADGSVTKADAGRVTWAKAARRSA